ncbi:MAG: helix-turn-helix transcriptional regulator [Acidaminococcaceae bacterium]|nr:helix-turn-helix transcriptional regulator [Acidaminococcaceae bacterium]
MELYENIRTRRIALRMTQQELAARLGYKSTSTIAKIEAGVNDIPQAKIVAFARALATTPGALLGLGDERGAITEKNISLSLSEKNVSLTDQERALIESTEN